MSDDLQLIESALKRAARRRRLERAWQAFWKGLLLSATIWLLVFGVYKITPLPLWSLWTAAGVAGTVVLSFVLYGFCRRVSVAQTALWVDQQQNLKERLSTALEFGHHEGESEWQRLLVSDAAKHARSLDPRALLPFRFPHVGRWALLVVILAAGLGFVPEYRSKAQLQKKKDAAHIKDTGKQLADFVRRNLEQRKPVLEPATEKALQTAEETGQRLTKASLTRSEALRDLASVTEKLEKEQQQLKNPALQRMEKAARESGGENAGNKSPEAMQKQIDAMQKALGKAATAPEKLDKMKADLEKAQQALNNMPEKDSAAGEEARAQLSQALSEMSRQMKDMGQSLDGLDDAIKALQNNQTDLAMKNLEAAMTDLEKLRQMAKAMQQMQQQAGKMGKDLAEQLENGQAQAAKANLEKMIEKLKQGNMSQEDMEKLMEEVAKAVKAGKEYGKVGDLLDKASKQGKAGKKGEAAENLAEAAKELDKLMKQMADAEAIQAALEAMEQAQMAIATGKEWGECNGPGCKECGGLGCWKCMNKKQGRWGKGGKPGGGVGTWAEENGWTYFPEQGELTDNSGANRPDMDARGHTDRPEDRNPNMAPTKVRGQMSPGGQMPSITLKGVSIKGQSSVEYQEAATAAQVEAQSALNQDQVPRAYQNTVRDYFDDLKK